MTAIASSGYTSSTGLYFRIPRQFGRVGLPSAKEIIAHCTWKHAACNKKFMEGDHWQERNGIPEGWVGPLPRSTEIGFSETRDTIKKAFTSRNVVKELVERHVNGLLGWEPDWGFTLRRAVTKEKPVTIQEQILIEEANAFLTTWWDNRKGHTFIKNCASRVLHQKRASMRLYVPPGRLVEVEVSDGISTVRQRGIAVQNDSMNDALDFIWIETPEIENSTVFCRQSDKEHLGITIGLNQETGLEELELTYLKKNDRLGKPVTVISLKRGQGYTEDSPRSSTYEFDFGGRLTMYEIERDPLITQQIQQGQKALNLTISVLPRAIITGGFLERILLNAQLPGRFEDDGQGGKGRFIPEDFKVGAGTTQFVTGVEHEDEDTGVTKLMEPKVVFREPVDTANLIKALRAQYQVMLEEADQVHILISGDAVASGVAREQARIEFLLSLQKTQEIVEQLGRWMIETVMAMGEAFLGESGKYTNELKAYFHCRINAGAVSSDERAQYQNEVNEGKLSEETALHLSGQGDPAAELQRIEKTPFRTWHMAKLFGEALSILIEAGYPLPKALEKLGVPKEEIDKVVEEQEKQKLKEQEHELNMAKEQGAIDIGKEKEKAKLRPKPVASKTLRKKVLA